MSGVDLASLTLRLVLASIFIVQGYRKLFAPPGAKGSGHALRQLIVSAGMPFAAFFAVLTGLVELVGGVLLLLGLLTRLAAIPLLAVLAVAIVKFKWKEGFQGGWDWPLACFGGTLALVFLGGGILSVDHLLRLP